MAKICHQCMFSAGCAMKNHVFFKLCGRAILTYFRPYLQLCKFTGDVRTIFKTQVEEISKLVFKIFLHFHFHFFLIFLEGFEKYFRTNILEKHVRTSIWENLFCSTTFPAIRRSLFEQKEDRMENRAWEKRQFCLGIFLQPVF